jgi:TolB-like protein/class 3 adenylate cyclase
LKGALLVERKLAAILAADVVGYSALMERDEAGTHRRLLAGRKELFEPEIARHHGRIFKLMGDGLLAEFGSVVEAVECAVSLQRGLAERNAAVTDEQHIQVRIGINLGEVIVEGEDRYGEGVNIAARLEQLAEPGGIWVSGKVAREVEKKLAFGFEAMGEQRVKNIAEPVAAYRVRLDGPLLRPLLLARTSRLRLVAAAVALLVLTGGAITWFVRMPAPSAVIARKPAVDTGKPSLAVLPFANLSDDKEQGYVADGIGDDLTTELARIPDLFVVSRNAALAYKEKATPPAQIAQELGVRYLVEGSMRRAADELRINAQLIDTQTGGHIWAERFDGEWTDVFGLQDRIVGQIASALRLRLASDQSEMAGGTKNPAAYEEYLRGQMLQRSGDPTDWVDAIASFEQALALDPDFGRAAAMAAWMYRSAQAVKSKQLALGISGDDARDRGRTFFERAAAHPSATYYQLLAEDLLYQQRSDEAVAAAERAIALDPSDPWSHEEMGYALTFNGRPEDGRIYLDTANRLDPVPSDPKWRYVMAGLAEFSMGRFEAAAALLENIDSKTNAKSYWDFWATYNGLRLLIATYGHLGRDVKVLKDKLTPMIADVEDKEFTVAITMSEFPFKRSVDAERLVEGLRKAGVSDLGDRAKLGSSERLTGPEIKALIFGRTVEGREVESNDDYRRETAEDGVTKVKVGSWSDSGTTTVESDFLCSAFPTSFRGCGAIFRNPTGTAEKRNEYLLVRPFNSFEFSAVK